MSESKSNREMAAEIVIAMINKDLLNGRGVDDTTENICKSYKEILKTIQS